MIKKILFPTEFGPVSARAEDEVIGLARALGASCHLVHVIEAIHINQDQEVEKLYATLQTRAAAEFEKIFERFRAEKIDCTGHIEIGKRWRSILAAAREQACDLIVMGTRRFDEQSQPYFGSTSQKVFVTTSIPMLVIPSKKAESA